MAAKTFDDASVTFDQSGRTFDGYTVPSYSYLATQFDTYGRMSAERTVETVTEEVPLGVFVLTDVDVQTRRGETMLTLQGSDRSLRIQRNRWTEPYQIADGTNVATALENLLSDRYDDVLTDFTTTDATIAATVLGTDTNNDPWSDALRIAEAAGLELYFDSDGVARLDSVTDYSTASADEVYAEDEDAMVTSLTRAISVQETYNGVIATAEGTGTGDTYRSTAWDDDETSPTYRYGPFGEVPMFFSSPLITSQATADSAAAALLAKHKGAVESVEWEQINDPSLDVGDVIALSNSAAKINRYMVIDRLTIPLRVANAMRAVARTVRTLTTGSS